MLFILGVGGGHCEWRCSFTVRSKASKCESQSNSNLNFNFVLYHKFLSVECKDIGETVTLLSDLPVSDVLALTGTT